MLVAVWFSIQGTYNVPGSQLMLSGGRCLVGFGPNQQPAGLQQLTIGQLREEYGLADELPSVLADDRNAWLYTDDFEMGNGDNSATVVFIEA